MLTKRRGRPNRKVEMSMVEALEKCFWKALPVIENILDSPTVPLYIKKDVAMFVVGKAVPQTNGKNGEGTPIYNVFVNKVAEADSVLKNNDNNRLSETRSDKLNSFIS